MTKWLGAGHYEITKGLFKRLWRPKSSLSVVMIPSLVRNDEGGGGGSVFLLTESGENILTEDGVYLAADSVVVE